MIKSCPKQNYRRNLPPQATGEPAPKVNLWIASFFRNRWLDAIQRLLMLNEKLVPITPKVFETLLALVERCGSVVEESGLMGLLWPDTFVEESN
jgi:hypothetical protein